MVLSNLKRTFSKITPSSAAQNDDSQAQVPQAEEPQVQDAQGQEAQVQEIQVQEFQPEVIQAPRNDDPGAKMTGSKDLQQDEVVEVEDVQHDDMRGISVTLNKYSRDLYLTYEAGVTITQTVMPSNTLRNIDLTHYKELKKGMAAPDGGYKTSCGKMTVTVRREANPHLQDLNFSSIINSSKVLESLKVDVIDGLHRRQAIMDILQEFPEATWAKEPIVMIVKIRQDKKDMTETEILALGAEDNVFSSLVRKGPSSFMEKLHAIKSFYESFYNDYNIGRDQDIRIVDIAQGLDQMKVFNGASYETCRVYARVGKIFFKFADAWSLIQEMNSSFEGVSNLGMSHLDHSIYGRVDNLGAQLLLQSIWAYVNKKGARGTFSASVYYNFVQKLYDECRSLHEQYGVAKNLDFESFLKVEVQHTAIIKVSIRQHFINQSRLFLLLPKTKQAASDQTRIARFRAKIANHFSPPPPKSTPKKTSVRAPVQAPAVRTTSTRRERTETARFTPDAPVVQPRKKTRATVKRTTEAQEEEIVPVTTDDVVMTTSAAPQEVPGSTQPEDSEPFDDHVPDYLPIGVRDIESNREHLEYMKKPWPKGPFRAFELIPELRDAAMEKLCDRIAVTRLLRAIGIPYEHRAKYFFTGGFMVFMSNMLWILGAYKVLREHSGSPTTEDEKKELWKKAYKKARTGLGTGYFAAKREELKHRGYAVLESFGDMSCIPPDVIMDSMKKSLIQKGSEKDAGDEKLRYYVDTQQLFDFFMTTFPGEEALKLQENRELWNPIVNQGHENGDMDKQDKGIGRFMSQRKLMMEHLEKSSENVWVARSKCALDMWIGFITTVLCIRVGTNGESFLSKTGGRLLLTGKGCPRQNPHNDFPVDYENPDNDDPPGYFIIVSGADSFPLWVCDHSHHFVRGTSAELERIAKVLKMRKIVVPPRSFFIGHGFMTHAGAGDEDKVTEKRTMRYHIYLTPEHKFLPNAIQYALESLPFEESDTNENESVDEEGADDIRPSPVIDEDLLAEEFFDINDENGSDG